MSQDRFLLIKNWSFILWSDVEHVLSQLLIAELTGRIPVIYWPTLCLHNGFVQTNGFELYFEPVNGYTISDIARPDYSFFPPIWNADNLLVEDRNKDSGQHRNIGDIYSSDANVVVSDIYIPIMQLLPFIKKDHPAYGMTAYQVSCLLFRKYIRLKQDIDAEIQGFFNSWLRSEGITLAVHVMKAQEKTVYDPGAYVKKDEYAYITDPQHFETRKKRLRRYRETLEPNRGFHAEIEKLIEKQNVRKIFLITDSAQILREYQKKYGDMLTSTQVRRLENGEPVSTIENPMVSRKRGIETVKDAYVAAKCSFFLGSDCSSLSHAVSYIRDWAAGNCRFMYHNVHNRKYPINLRLVWSGHNKVLTRIRGWLRKLAGAS